MDRARQAADQLGGRLSTELASQLGSDAPAAAIGVCSQIAPAAAAELSREGLGIRRIGTRHRNPGHLQLAELYPHDLATGFAPGDSACACGWAPVS